MREPLKVGDERLRVHSPIYLLDAARFRARHYLGHNPAGGAMILALIATLAAVCVTGIMMTTDAYWGVAWVGEARGLAANLAIVPGSCKSAAWSLVCTRGL